MNRILLLFWLFLLPLSLFTTAAAQPAAEERKAAPTPMLWDRKDPVNIPPGLYKNMEARKPGSKAAADIPKESLMRRIKELEEKIRLQQVEIIELKKKCQSLK